MKQQIIKPIDVLKIADEIEKTGSLEMYWNYRDSLTEEQIIKIITEEDYLFEVESELRNYNSEYIGETINTIIQNYETENNISLSDEEKENLRFELEGRFNFNINDLIRNSGCNIRVTLQSNEDMIYFGADKEIKDSETIKEFKRVFRRKYKKEDFENEINNVFDYGLFTFYFKVGGLDILKLREQVLKGFITLRKGLSFGLFDSFNGSGSILEMELLHSITLNLKDWRIKNIKEAIIKGLGNGNEKSYYDVNIKADNISHYSIQETYGLAGWQNF